MAVVIRRCHRRVMGRGWAGLCGECDVAISGSLYCDIWTQSGLGLRKCDIGERCATLGSG